MRITHYEEADNLRTVCRDNQASNDCEMSTVFPEIDVRVVVLAALNWTSMRGLVILARSDVTSSSAVLPRDVNT